MRKGWRRDTEEPYPVRDHGNIVRPVSCGLQLLKKKVPSFRVLARYFQELEGWKQLKHKPLSYIMHRCDKPPLLLASKYPDGLYLKLTLSSSCAKVTFAGEKGADTGESDRETKAKPLPTVYE